jgi:hypothetical protein
MADIIESINSSELEPKDKMDKKCAPGIKFDAGSCIDLAVLIEMVNAYNKTNPNTAIKMHPNMETLNPRKYKKYLVKNIQKRLDNKCTTQSCWADQGFVRSMEKMAKEKLKNYTFRPDGPDGQFEWLNTININKVMAQYEQQYPDFLFLGAVPMDFDDIPSLGIADLNFSKLMDEGKTKLGVIFNLDESWKSGSHWTAGFFSIDINKSASECFYYDSYSSNAPPRVRRLMRRFVKFCQSIGVKDIRADYNHIRAQYGGADCGNFSIRFITRMLSGDSFEDICNDKPTRDNKHPDKEVNLCRNVYFRNVNINNGEKQEGCE